MNSITIIGTIVTEPELRYTSSDQLPICKAWLQFEQVVEKGELAPVNVKVVAFGKKADELHGIGLGSQVAIDGNLRMQTVENDKGYKEKFAEINVSTVEVLLRSVTAKAAPTAEEEPLIPV